MRNIHALFVGTILTFIAATSHSQSHIAAIPMSMASALKITPEEQQAFQERTSVRMLLAMMKSCESIKQNPTTVLYKPVVTSASKERVTSLSVANTDFSLEYESTSGSKPSAIVGLGARIPAVLTERRSQEALSAIKARVILYRAVRASCGMKQVTHMDLRAGPNLLHASFDEFDPYWDDFPIEWVTSSFWESSWEPEYTYAVDQGYGSGAFANAQCVQTCQNVCDGVSDITMYACGVYGGIVALANPALGLVVGSACGAGSLVGKYYCRLVQCDARC